MKPITRWLIVAAGLAAAVGLFLVVRPQGSPGPGPSPSPPASPTPTTVGSGSPQAPSSPTPPPEATAQVIRVTVRDGQVDGPREPAVRRGDRVRIVVDADVTDEVHLHGYDLSTEVSPGSPGVLTFRATAAGVFEVELEEAGLLLFELTVSP